MMYYGPGWGWGIGAILGGIGMILFWVLVIVGIIWLVRAIARGGGYHYRMDQESPVDIARKRYARGEITKEQFEQIKKDLGT